MKSIVAIAVCILFSGCSPKMGKDVLVEPVGNVRWENSKSELLLGVLSLLGASKDKEAIRIGTDVNVTNRWHSELTLTQLSYALMDGNQTLAKGYARIDGVKGFTVVPHTSRILPLAIAIDPKSITMGRVIEVMQEKRKLTLKGEAVLEVWGQTHRVPFKKDATKVISKAFRGEEQAFR